MNNTDAMSVETHKTRPKLQDFLAAFFPDDQEPIHFRFFKPKGAPDNEHNRPLSSTVTREQLTTDKEFQQRLKSINERRGVFFVVNSGGDKDSEISRYNAFFVENDLLPIAEQHAKLDACPIRPSMLVETKKSVHAYWLIASNCSEAEWRDIQERLIDYFDGDQKIKNPSRLMRLPYFQHLTYNKEDGSLTPKRVEIVMFEPQNRYTVAQLREAFPAVQVSTNETAPGLQFQADSNADLKEMIQQKGKRNGRGKYEMRCPAHNGESETSLFFDPETGAFKCLAGCPTTALRLAFGLPEKPQVNSSNSLIRYVDSPSGKQTCPSIDNKALYGLAGEFVETIYPHTEADKAALLIQMLVGFGNIVGRTAYSVAENTRHYLNLYALIVGNTSAAKGSSFSQVRNILNRLDTDWAQNRNRSGLSSGEGLVEAVGETDRRLFLKESEFASVLARQGREANVLSATLRELWDDGRAYVMNRKANAVSTTDAHVSLVGHITPEELTKRLNATDLVNGYANRFLFACVRRSKNLPESSNASETAINALITKLQRAKQWAQNTGELKRDDEANALWRSVYPHLVEDKPGVFGKVVARARAQILRLSSLYALLDCSSLVKRVHLEAALSLWQYCEESARVIFAGSTGNKEADRILMALQYAPEQRLTKTAVITDVFRKNAKVEAINEGFAVLQRLGKADNFFQGDGKHKTEWWFLRSTKYELDEVNEVARAA